MERESNPLEAGPTLCRNGCGFFGSGNTDGFCSKCFKDALKKKQQPPNLVATQSQIATQSPPSIIANSPPSTTSSSSQTPPLTMAAVASPSLAVAANCSTALPTVPSLNNVTHSSPSLEQGESSLAADSGSASASTSFSLGESSLTEMEGDVSSPESEGAKKKKNKCQTCKKKVGLTGFTCRCGGLYCSVHRYSNEHRCTFDYREHGAEEIRRNNPVVKGEKIQKI